MPGYSFGGALHRSSPATAPAPSALGYGYQLVRRPWPVRPPVAVRFHNEAVRVRENDPSVTVLNGPPARRSPAKMRLLSRHQRRRTPIFASTSRNVVGAISAFLAED